MSEEKEQDGHEELYLSNFDAHKIISLKVTEPFLKNLNWTGTHKEV